MCISNPADVLTNSEVVMNYTHKSDMPKKEYTIDGYPVTAKTLGGWLRNNHYTLTPDGRVVTSKKTVLTPNGVKLQVIAHVK